MASKDRLDGKGLQQKQRLAEAVQPVIWSPSAMQEPIKSGSGSAGGTGGCGEDGAAIDLWLGGLAHALMAQCRWDRTCQPAQQQSLTGSEQVQRGQQVS